MMDGTQEIDILCEMGGIGVRRKAVSPCFHRRGRRKRVVMEIYRENSGQSAVFFGRFSFPGAAPTAMSIYRENGPVV